MDQNNDRQLRPMRNQDFRHKDLTGYDLSNCDLTGSQFDGSYGVGLNISGSDVTGTSWRGAEQIQMKAKNIVCRGKLQMTGIMAPGLEAPGADVDEWLLDVGELTDCNLDGSKVRVLHARSADMRRGSARGWEVQTMKAEHARLPEAL